MPRRATSEFHRQWTQVTPFGKPDWTMTWTPVHVEITAGDGSIIGARDNGREAFDRSFDGKWDPLNLAYFNGYAMWTYHATPLVFGEPGYEARDVAPIENEGETLRGVAVRFPEGVHSHSREQRFYFDSDGLLRRHDYTVDVWADTPAAQIPVYTYAVKHVYPAAVMTELRNWFDDALRRRLPTARLLAEPAQIAAKVEGAVRPG